MENTLTDAIYRAHQPPEVLALMDTADYGERITLASKLASQGFLIDWAIMVWGWDPAQLMYDRVNDYKRTWGPSANMGNPTNEALAGPMPKGAVPFSTDANDYPAFNPPPVPVVVLHDEVGQSTGNGAFEAIGVFNPDGTLKHSIGYSVQHDGQPVYFFTNHGPWGLTTMWLNQTRWDAKTTGAV